MTSLKEIQDAVIKENWMLNFDTILEKVSQRVWTEACKEQRKECALATGLEMLNDSRLEPKLIID